MNFVATVLPRLLLGLLISSLIGLVAYRRGSLSKSGVLGAVMTGTTIFGFGGFTAGVLLVAFFVSSSLLSHFKQNSRQKQQAAEMFDKGGQRDLGQALANGGAAAAFSIAYFIAQQAPYTDNVLVSIPYGLRIDHSLPYLMALSGSLATVTADTWATELGVLSKSKTRLITNPLKKVEPGTSGGVSVLGLMAALTGAMFIGIMFIAFDGRQPIGPIFASTSIGGLLGSLFDSVLGATKQAIYYSDQRQKETEKAIEKDGDDPSRIVPNKLIRGWKWLNNDWVNFISSVVGALISALLVTLIL